MLYLIDQRAAEPEILLGTYRIILRWAALRGDRFVIRIRPDIYDDPDEVKRFSALGKIREANPEVFHGGGNIFELEGTPDEGFVSELTRKAAPRKAVSGDLCPVEDLLIFRAENVLFASYEYGRDLVFDLNEEEINNLRQTLRENDLDTAPMIAAPPSWDK